MKKIDVVDSQLYWFVYTNTLNSDIELLLVKSSVFSDRISFLVMLDDGKEQFASVPIEPQEIDGGFPNLFHYDDKFTAELRWFELFFKNFESVSGMDITRFLELYRYAQEKRPDLIFKGM